MNEKSELLNSLWKIADAVKARLQWGSRVSPGDLSAWRTALLDHHPTVGESSFEINHNLLRELLDPDVGEHGTAAISDAARREPVYIYYQPGLAKNDFFVSEENLMGVVRPCV